MQDSEYVVAARAVAVYDVLATVARERAFVVVHADARHLTLAIRPGGGERTDVTALVAVLDAGHGLSKLVLTGRDDRDWSTVDLGGFSRVLFTDVEQRLLAPVADRTRGALVAS